MGSSSNINNINLSDYKNSYTLIYCIENLFSEFYKNDNNEHKERLLRRLDKEISDKLKMPEANFVFENKEFTLDDKNIYYGKLTKINSPYELIGRYLFEKRQQYQRICINNNDMGSFDEQEFKDLKDSYDVLPLSKSSMYTPYSKGMKKYLLNYNKIDALLYMLDTEIAVLGIVDLERLFKNVDYLEGKSLSEDLEKFQRDTANILYLIQEMGKKKSYGEALEEKILDFDLKKNIEKYILAQMLYELFNEKPTENKRILLFFHENVWENLDFDHKKVCIEVCNKFVANLMDVEPKNVVYDNGPNSYHFVDSKNVYIGKLNENSSYFIVARFIYEYCFDRIYKDMEKCDNKELWLKDYESCKEMYMKKHSYEDVKDFEFFKKARKKSLKMLKRTYNYMNESLFVYGKIIPLPISKDKFVVDMLNTKKRR